MAKSMGYAMFCVLLVLASWTKYGQASSVYIYNGGNDMTIQNTIEYNNGTITREPAAQEVLNGTVYKMDVVPGITSVHTWYTGVTGIVPEYGYLESWGTTGMNISCNDCYWVVDSTGFSVAASPSDTLKHVADWEY